MKLSFTTLGCPEWDLDTIITRAVEYGYDGIDFRGLQGNMNVYELSPFATDYADTRSKIEQAGLQVSCFSSSITLVSAAREEQNLEELKQYVKLCERFGAKYIRAFGGKLSSEGREASLAIGKRQISQMVPYLREAGVKLVVETHDDWTSCDDVAALIEGTSPDTVAVLWDVHHPYRMIQESPERTWEVLGSRIEYTHWKDSVPAADQSGKHSYCFMGEGDIPLGNIYSVLKANGYDSWYTLEWEKKWHPELAEPELALPQYVQFMRALAASAK
ncbi:MAG: sugar phosphate isomerase/epimerase [Paenibacillus sp.]|jgi:sugar phosphate isomerase/epimerase|nr:sugar phosphate isomerase/epimerase [Paenibacillus sp.]